MKKSFVKILPIATAVLLWTSCSKDENNEQKNVENKNGVVELPVSVKIANANQNSISKVTFSNDGGTISFDAADIETVKLSVTCADNNDISGTLDLVNEDGYKFSGKLSVPEDKVEEFTNTGITLQGEFSQTKGDGRTSGDNFDDLLNNCAHTYKTSFASNAEALELVDQNFYVYVERAKEMTIGNVSSFTEGNYYVFPISTQVEGKTVEPCKLYTIGKAVQSVTINDVPTETKVWGNAAFDVTVSISPSDATNQTVDWSKSTNVKVTDKGNGTYSVLITGNTGGKATLIATVDGVSSTAAEISVDANYVDLGTGVYWKTTDESSIYTFNNLPNGTPTKEEFSKLWDGTVTVFGTTFTNKNGSGASITLVQGDYWSSTSYDGGYNGWFVCVLQGNKDWHDDEPFEIVRVRLVRAAQ